MADRREALRKTSADYIGYEYSQLRYTLRRILARFRRG